MPIAKRIPAPNESGAGTRAEVAARYGLTVDELNAAIRNWVENEGFDGQGNEYETIHDWLVLPHNTRRDNTPFQKGDDNPV